MSTDPWQDYLAAARRLDAVRQAATSAAGQQAQGVQSARQELTGVRARLVPQQTRLRALGVPERELLPSEPEVAAAGQAMAAGPEAVLAALREARAAADAADAATFPAGMGPLPWPADWRRFLLLYGSAALVLLVVLAAVCLVGVAALRN
ncbi:hypothetical protein [Plantactinospora sp. CA-290183]|uniref:hypothetical protein n=1 Tax=Plantactinospora sp. CA-290183 TaxID=3240006 RepID=UPI003D8B221F